MAENNDKKLLNVNDLDGVSGGEDAWYARDPYFNKGDTVYYCDDAHSQVVTDVYPMDHGWGFDIEDQWAKHTNVPERHLSYWPRTDVHNWT